MAYLPYMFTSFLCVGVFVYAAVQLATLTPLYTPVECRKLGAELSEPQVNVPWINMTGTTRKECQNPNPYAISVESRSSGKVFVKNGTERVLVGQSDVLPAEFPAHGKAVGESIMQIGVLVADAQALLLSSPVIQVVTELHVRSEAKPQFFGIEMSAAEDKDEVCGFEVRVMTRKVGPEACAQSFEELAIPDVDAEPQVRLMHLDKKHLQAQELKKNVAFSSILALSFLGAAASIAVGARRVHAQRQARDAKLDEKNIECEAEVPAGSAV